MTYDEFIASKRAVAVPVGIERPPALNPALFGFQADLTRWALRRGKAAIWADCGLGKGWMALEWSRVVREYTGRPVLILTPLAVAQQFVSEGQKLGVPVKHARDGAEIRPGVNVTNYDRLHLFDPDAFGGVVADESSIIKDHTSATRNALLQAFARTPFRLACTATPAPNDHMELGNHAEFLGVMSRSEMLAMFFVHDGGATQDWRLKGHAARDFWRWVCSWAVAIRAPSDLGHNDDGFRLPALNIHQREVAVGDEFARAQGSLFTVEARGLQEQREARRASLAARVRVAAEIVAREPEEPWILWCDLNDESSALAAIIPGAVEIRGSDSVEQKEAAMAGFTAGSIRVVVTKPSIAGWGLNWQHCARAVYVGLSNSFEAWYQSVRRIYRFGQRRDVECYMVTSDAEGAVVANLKRKQADADRMVASMVAEMGDFSEVSAARSDRGDYQPSVNMEVPTWLRQQG